MSVWRLAYRNLQRNRRRSLATLLSLAVGSSAILVFDGYTTNVRYSMQTAYVRAGGHLQIQHADFLHYGAGNPASFGIPGYQGLIDALHQDSELSSMVRVVSPILQFGGVAGNYDAGVSRTVLGTGYVPADVNRMREWNEYQLRYVRPRYALEGAGADAAVIGQGVARVLQLCQPLGVPAEDCPPQVVPPIAGQGKALPNDVAAIADMVAAERGGGGGVAGKPQIELLVSQPRGAPNVAALKVVAAESHGFKELDEVSLTLQFSQAQHLVYGRTVPRATSILIQLKRTADIVVAQRRIEALVARTAPNLKLAVLTFDTLNPYYVQSQQMFDTIFGFIFVLIGCIVLFTVGNTMNAAVVERTVEVGTLRAIGLRGTGIRTLFLTEGLLLGVAGAAVGVAAALAFGAAINAMHLTWLPPGASERIPMGIDFHGQGVTLAATSLALIAVAALSAWLPARRAAALKIVDALRHA